jgi:hypothetical protein
MGLPDSMIVSHCQYWRKYTLRVPCGCGERLKVEFALTLTHRLRYDLPINWHDLNGDYSGWISECRSAQAAFPGP